MLARDEILGILQREGALPVDIDVQPYARNIDPPLRTTVMVRIDKVRPSKVAGGLWEVEAALVIVGAQTTPGSADDELDAALQDVLFALDTQKVANALTWTEATRAVYGEPDPTNPAYEVAVNTHIKKEQ